MALVPQFINHSVMSMAKFKMAYLDPDCVLDWLTLKTSGDIVVQWWIKILLFGTCYYLNVEMKVVALISGGKDSCFNMMHVVADGHEIVALANLFPAASDTDELDSYMYQTVGHEAIELYSEAMQLPLFRRCHGFLIFMITQHLAHDHFAHVVAGCWDIEARHQPLKITGTPQTLDLQYEPSQQDEVEDLYLLLQEIREKVYFDAVATGAILSDYQRIRVESVCSRLGVTSLSYLWRRDQKELLQEMIDCGLEAILIKTAALGLEPRKHLGKTLFSMQQTLHELSEKYGCHICGEGGEFETFTLDCPLFKKRIVIDESEIIIHSDDYFASVGYLKLKKLHLEGKRTDTIPHIESLPLMTSSKWKSRILSQISSMTKGGEMKNPITSTKVTWKGALKYNAKCEAQICQHGRYLVVSNLLGKVTGEVDEKSIQDAASSVLQTLTNLLREHTHEARDVCYIQLNVADMSHYKYINDVYSKFFKTSLPARACIGCLYEADNAPHEKCILQAYCISCHNPSSRATMHVQGMSHWAPANIGPFSQCVMADNLLLVSGTIALLPGNMNLINGDARTQAYVSLLHIEKVLSAMAAGAGLEDLVQCICYVTEPKDISGAQNCWKMMSTESHDGQLCEPLYLAVKELPKGAKAEWQGVACKKSESSLISRTKSASSRSVDYQISVSKWVCDDTTTYSCTCSRGSGGNNGLGPQTSLKHLQDQLCTCLRENHLSIEDIVQASLFFTGDGLTPQVLQDLLFMGSSFEKRLERPKPRKKQSHVWNGFTLIRDSFLSAFILSAE